MKVLCKFMQNDGFFNFFAKFPLSALYLAVIFQFMNMKYLLIKALWTTKNTTWKILRRLPNKARQRKIHEAYYIMCFTQLELTFLTLFQMTSRRKMFLNYFWFHWDFIDYNVNVEAVAWRVVGNTATQDTF